MFYRIRRPSNLRHLLHWPHRHASYATKTSTLPNPVLESKVYSKVKCELPYTKFGAKTFPNPLFTFDKGKLMSLSEEEFRHLLSIPYRSISETDQFCFNVIQIVHESLIQNPAKAKMFLRNIKDEEMREVILNCLKQYYKTNLVRDSILQFTLFPEEPATRRSIFTNIEDILFESSTPQAERLVLLLSYLRKLALCSSPNGISLLLQDKTAKAILQHIPESKRADLYSYFLHINMKFSDMKMFDEFKQSLLHGSNLSSLIAKTGIIDAKWHHLNDYVFDDEHKQKLVNFFTFNDLHLFTNQAIESHDLLDANLYLDLLVAKLETLSLKSNPTGHGRRVQTLLHVLLQHSMTFKGPQECLKFLRYMPQMGLEIRPATLLRVLIQLRKDECFDEALYLINNLHNCELSGHQHAMLVNEIVNVIAKKFAAHPEVIVGYFAAMFGSEVLHLLQRLGLLQLIYKEDFKNLDFSSIKKADIHQDLTSCNLQHSHLQVLYEVVLKNIGVASLAPRLVTDLYHRYKSEVVGQPEPKTFEPLQVDDSVVALFLECLLKILPGGLDMNLLRDKRRYEAAKLINQDFFDSIALPARRKKVYLYDLLISSALLQHNDYAFAAALIKHSREHKMPPTFNQIYPFIVYHYVRGEVDRAEAWYNMMAKEGVKAKSTAGDRLFSIAEECGWTIKGSLYKRTIHHRNQKIRKELANMKGDHLKNMGINGEEQRSTDLLEELSAIIGAK